MRVWGDGNLLIGCNTEVQMERGKKMISVGNVKVTIIARVGEQVRRLQGGNYMLVPGKNLCLILRWSPIILHQYVFKVYQEGTISSDHCYAK